MITKGSGVPHEGFNRAAFGAHECAPAGVEYAMGNTTGMVASEQSAETRGYYPPVGLGSVAINVSGRAISTVLDVHQAALMGPAARKNTRKKKSSLPRDGKMDK